MLLKILLVVLFSAVAVFSQVPPIEPGVSQELAKWRAAHYSDVRYKLNLTLEKMSPVLKGTIEIRVVLSEPPVVTGGSGVVPIILDWRRIRGSESLSTISNVSINGSTVWSTGFSRPLSDGGPPKGGTPSAFEETNEHLIFREGVVPGENVIKLDFTSPILTSGSAITRYVDKEDGAEYIYSLFVPSDASTAFPVFDQPDLKGRFTLEMVGPADWKSVANEGAKCENYQSVKTSAVRSEPKTPRSDIPPELKLVLNSPEFAAAVKECALNTADLTHSFAAFPETKPISTYVFAFAAGPWAQVSEPGAVATGSAAPSNANDTKNRVATASRSYTRGSVFVRKSQLDKFKPHAAEVFRLNREGIKYLESYFDYKFPFPKYDLVLIPEFPFGGMEHAGATFLRESAIIFPQEPTKSDHISRAVLIFHEAAHQWFGDTVTMKWFDDLWLKEGFANFMAYKALEKIMPDANAWKVFYERIKQPAYATDSTKGTTPIYQPIKNLSAAKSAYGNIVYNKAPSFLKQTEFYLGADKFQTAVRAFLKKHEFKNAKWEDLVKEFEAASQQKLVSWGAQWIQQPGVPLIRSSISGNGGCVYQDSTFENTNLWLIKVRTISENGIDNKHLNAFDLLVLPISTEQSWRTSLERWLNRRFPKSSCVESSHAPAAQFFFPNYQDYGYGIFLLDDKSRDYVLKNIGSEKDDFLRTMMWGSLWDSVREGELDPKEYVELVIRALSPGFSRPTARKSPPVGGTPSESDESTIATLLGRVSTAMNYYLPAPNIALANARASATDDLQKRVEDVLIERIKNAPTAGQRITFYRAFINIAYSENARSVLKAMLKGRNLSGSEGVPTAKAPQAKNTLPTGRVSALTLRTKDKFDIVTRLAVLNDPEAAMLLADLEKSETSDDAKRYNYAARAAFPTKENREKYWNDFVNNKDISESWIEAAFGPFNAVRNSELSLPYLKRALEELPNHKRNRKIFFVNGWLAAFIGGQRSEEALSIVNKFLADNPTLDNDLRLKILENVDLIERAVKIRAKYRSS
ncbi:MAG: ERAP1-like C-terminal domain-containing protein [Pyrinomonadaceae bacterium]|nr:ERAP1-like C-terminal domain-containing protein [Pyrinomonadaceae bacterium]